MKPIHSLSVLLAALTAGPAALVAQEPADTVRADELVVTATRVAVPLSATAADVTIIRGEELAEGGETHVLEALRAVAGISVVQNGSFGATTSIFLRGGESDYVQVLIDGVPLNEPGGRADLAHLTVDNIERIEIVRGPVSVLYGSDAVTGVIQIFTREGQGAPRVSVGVRGGSHGSLSYDAGLTGGSGIVSYSASASRTTSDGIYEFNSEYANTSASGRLGVRPDERTEATLTVRYTDGVYHFPTDGAGRVVDRNQFSFEERLTLGLALGRYLTERLEARVLLASSAVDRGTDDRPDDAADPNSSHLDSELQRRSVDARLNYHIAEATILTAGAAFEQQEEETSFVSESEWGPFESGTRGERDNIGYYAQAIANVGGRLSVTAGARVDDNETFGTFETYRLGAALPLPGGTRLRAAFGTAFKEPQLIESHGGSGTVGNPDLQPERSRSWELGLEQALLDGTVFVSGTYFDQRFRDMIQYTAQAAPDEPNYVNIAAADVDGVELEARVEPVPGLTLGATYTWLDSEVEDAGYQSGPNAEFVEGRRLIRRPTHAARVSAAYRIHDRGSLDLGVSFVGERDDLDFSGWPAERVTLDAYTRVDLGAELELLRADGRRPAVTGTLRIDNLLDEAYEEVLNFPARGRTILVGVRLGAGL